MCVCVLLFFTMFNNPFINCNLTKNPQGMGEG